MTERLRQQIRFIAEIDRLKHVMRRTLLLDSSRHENDAEHSWHLAVMAMVLAEYANQPGTDLLRVIKMVLIHDIVEIDAGDTFLYNTELREQKRAAEQAGAERVFGLLPADLAGEFRTLWEEFELRRTPESRFARALDRLQPMIHNYMTQGRAWREHGVAAEQVIGINSIIAEGSAELWSYAQEIVDDAVRQGFLSRGNDCDADH